MLLNQFVARVAELNPERSHHDAAHAAAQAVLEEIGSHLDPDRAASLAAELPEDLAPTLQREARGSRGDPDLVARVVERVGLDEDEAAGYVDAVCAALREQLDPEQYDRTVEGLPPALREQLATSREKGAHRDQP